MPVSFFASVVFSNLKPFPTLAFPPACLRNSATLNQNKEFQGTYQNHETMLLINAFEACENEWNCFVGLIQSGLKAQKF